ncbi:DUF4332 domain-containing protein [uncultured Alsobacter sp.]|uniref:DUF4332 domain-containing protein n=1 Tax=uncultured Alsobacter sp. TaxID=1748258 RepID=UPI0025CBD690|nr:DUF4332 domain-containing protein [uncultured Alsobacter sp.]
MAYPIATIEGIGPAYAEKLKAGGIATTADLLDKAKDPKGRKAVAAASGITETLILKWTNMADLLRVPGVGEEYSELLEAAGVDTVKELRNRNVANLTKAMEEANAKRKLVRAVPSEKVVAKWVEAAKELPPMMIY